MTGGGERKPEAASPRRRLPEAGERNLTREAPAGVDLRGGAQERYPEMEGEEMGRLALRTRRKGADFGGCEPGAGRGQLV